MRIADDARIAAYRARGWWTDTTIDDLFAACVRRRPGHIALADPPNRAALVGSEPRRLTFAELDREVDALCAALTAAGCRPGDVVVTQLPNVVEHVSLYLAGARLGLVLSPLAMLAREFELTHAIGLLSPRAVVTIDRFKGAAHAAWLGGVAGPSATPVLAFGDAVPDGVARLDATAEQDVATPRARPDADDVYTVCWTSGTEGVPKAVPRSHNEWLAISWAHYEATAIGPDDRLLNPFPIINMASIGGCFTSWLHAACTLHLHHPLDLAVFLQQIATERITYTVAPPAVLTMLLKDERLAASADLSSVRCIGSGSAPLSEWLIAGYRDRFGIEIVNLFGSNEGVSLVSGPREAPDPGHRARYFPRFGRPEFRWDARVAGMIETRLIDRATGDEITSAQVPGELVVRGPTVFSGYLGPAEQTRAAFTDDGFYRTGDLFEIAGEAEEARFYRYVGRAKQIIARGGMKISPDELDHLLAGHPGVVEVATVGVPDEVMGERVCAVVVPKPGVEVTLASVAAHLEERGAARYKFPERLVVAERLPRNAMGKVVRSELATIARAALGEARG